MTAKRELPNWLDSYLTYVEDTESATIFHKWVGLSTIASALRKKIHLQYGRLRYYANMYVILVADPGTARKSRSIDYGVDILQQIPEVVTSADAITKEALLEDIQASKADEPLPNGTIFSHSSISIISREFESFLGHKKENTKMVVLLTDLFDAQELPWKYRTKHSGSNVLPSLYVNLLAATTPDSLASCLPASAIGGGLTSRIIFVYADRRAKKCAKPEVSDRLIRLRLSLIQDLARISRISGTYSLDTEADARWVDFYNRYEEIDPERLCKDSSFNGWYSRKPTYLLKLAMICAAAESDEKIIHWRHITKAMAYMMEVESVMHNAFKAVGKSEITSEVDTVVNIIRTRGWITEKQLMSIVWRDMDARKFDNVINTAIKTGKVARSFVGPKEEKGEVWYASKG